MLVMPGLELEFPQGMLNMPVIFFQHDAGEFLQEFQLLFNEEMLPGASVTVIQRGGDPWSGGYIFKHWNPDEDLHLEKYGSEIVIRSARSLDFAIGDSNHPQGYVELSALPDYGSAGLYEVQQALLFGGGGAVIIAGLVGLWISHWLASPMKRLAETAVEMGEGDLTVRADVKSSGEIGELASQFNHMADQLETSFKAIGEERDTLRRFITDALSRIKDANNCVKEFQHLTA